VYVTWAHTDAHRYKHMYTPSGILLCPRRIIGTGALDRVIRLEEFQLQRSHVVRFNDFVGPHRGNTESACIRAGLRMDHFVDMFKDHHTSLPRPAELHVALGRLRKCINIHPVDLPIKYDSETATRDTERAHYRDISIVHAYKFISRT